MSDTFEYLGETFSFDPDGDPFAMAEFAEAMDDGIEATGMRAIAVCLRLAMGCVAADDQARFRAVSRKHRAKPEQYMQVYKDWLEGQAERPTGLPSDSSDGPGETPADFESPPVVSVTSLPERAADRQVRGDLALALSRTA